MFLGKVIGSTWATQKDPGMEGMSLVVIQPLDQNREPIGKALIAVDPNNQVGKGETIFYVESGDAAQVREGHIMPSDATIVGIVDSLSTDVKP
ncbi:MAG: EutN/CcmL family microcompartment protein [Candidatus Hinthialibacter antarcticus]|nr:EutN/CcmL family microcompartment protein [Candidatus Hinthialibacter antarcticus]